MFYWQIALEPKRIRRVRIVMVHSFLQCVKQCACTNASKRQVWSVTFNTPPELSEKRARQALDVAYWA